MSDFNPDDILNTTTSVSEDTGRALTQEGTYPDSTITSIKVYEPHEKAKEKGVQARILVSFECPDSDVDLSTFMNFKENSHPKATYSKLIRAVWPDKEEASGKTMRDLEGETVNVSVFHEETNIDGRPITYAEFRFTQTN